MTGKGRKVGKWQGTIDGITGRGKAGVTGEHQCDVYSTEKERQSQSTPSGLLFLGSDTELLRYIPVYARLVKKKVFPKNVRILIRADEIYRYVLFRLLRI